MFFSCCYECRWLCDHHCHCFRYVPFFSAADTVTADCFWYCPLCYLCWYSCAIAVNIVLSHVALSSDPNVWKLSV
uniref:Uncharacterized protein n=1 Tax=Glossina palpalis gambiensis TaxID=67801 RepID=A0A1B0B250_9MUSC